MDDESVNAESVSSTSPRASLSDSTSSSPDVSPNTVSPPDASVTSIAKGALPPGVPELAFETVLAHGREKGQLTQAELIEALHTVELTPEVLVMLIDRVTAEGVALVEDEEEDPIVEVVPHKEPRPATRLNGSSGTRSSARRESNGKRAGSGESGGSAEDPVHTYLKEIGRVPLLNAELEVEIAQAIEAGNIAAGKLAAHELAEGGRARRRTF